MKNVKVAFHLPECKLPFKITVGACTEEKCDECKQRFSCLLFETLEISANDVLGWQVSPVGAEVDFIELTEKVNKVLPTPLVPIENEEEIRIPFGSKV